MRSLKDLRGALLTVTDKVYHYKAEQTAPAYIVWAEDGESSSYADNKRSTTVITGTAHYFTKTEYDPAVRLIEDAMSGIVAFSLSSVQYEDFSGYTHYEWTWEGAVEQWPE